MNRSFLADGRFTSVHLPARRRLLMSGLALTALGVAALPARKVRAAGLGEPGAAFEDTGNAAPRAGGSAEGTTGSPEAMGHTGGTDTPAGPNATGSAAARGGGADAPRSADATGSSNAGGPTLLVLGDSLSAEYGLSRGQGWVTLLEKRLAADEKTRRWQVVNASISGETTAGGKGRLPALLAQHRPKVVVIELGANDALRGLPLKATTANLRQMVADVQAAGARAVLVGLQVPPNYGPAYTRQFSQMFGRVAADTDSPLVPFLLEGFADDPDWFQADRIHPQAKAHPRMLDTVWAVLKDVL